MMVAIDEEVNKQGQPQGGKTPVVTTFGHRSALSTDESIGSGKKTSNVQGGEFESDDSSVDEVIDTDNFNTATQQKDQQITAESFARLKWLVLAHLTSALTISSITAALAVPALLGEGEKTLPSAEAFAAMLIPSIAGATSFALTVTAEVTLIAPHVIHNAILDAQAQVGTLHESLVSNPIAANSVDVEQGERIDYIALLKKSHRPDALNVLYNIAIIIAAGAFLFTNFDLADVAAVVEGEQVNDDLASKIVTYGTEMVVHTVGGAVFPAVLALMDKGVRKSIEACAGPSGLNEMKLPDFLALVNAVALGVAVLTTIALVESGLSDKMDNPLVNMAITVVMAALIAPAITLVVDAHYGNKPSESLNYGINAVGTGIARGLACLDPRALCSSNANNYNRVQTS